jgi:hypothetical protein
MTESINVILSRRECPFAGWVPIDEFEDLFSRITNTEIITPRAHRLHENLLGRVKKRFLGMFRSLEEPLPKGDLLLVVAKSPSDLNMISSVGDKKKNFRHVIGFVIDSYFIDAFGSSTRQYDHIFSTTEVGADAVRKRFGIPSSVLRQGFDCLEWACYNERRCIDLIGFGRQPATYHRVFQNKFHGKNSSLLYLHSPIGSVSGDGVYIERPMLLKLLQRSKISLAFHLGVDPPPNRPWDAEFVTSRWFESLASGCIVAGKRPTGIMAREMLDWKNATTELPDDPVAAAELIACIASDDALQRETRHKNVAEMRRRHDWRYRISEIYQHFELDLPPQLVSELAALKGEASF